MKISLILNGEDITLGANPEDSLFEVLQHETSLFAQTVCCQKGTCGQCHVLLDGREVPSCLVPFYQVRQREVITLEGFIHTHDYKLFRGLLDDDGLVFCSQCTDARIFHLSSYLEQFPSPTEAEIRLVLDEIPCRCGSRAVFARTLPKLIAQKEASRAVRR